MTQSLTPPGRVGLLQPAPPVLVTALPASPSDGQEVYFLADATNGVEWHFRYRAASAASSKWEFIGGPPLFAEVTAVENIAVATYSNLTTVGPSITIPAFAGDFIVEIGARIDVVHTAAAFGRMSYAIGATAAVDADAVEQTNTLTQFERMQSNGTRARKKTLAASTALVAKYASSAGNSNFANRWMSVVPVRVG